MAALPMIFLVSLLFPSFAFWSFPGVCVMFAPFLFNLSRCLSGLCSVVSGLVLVGFESSGAHAALGGDAEYPCASEAELFQADGDGHRPESRPVRRLASRSRPHHARASQFDDTGTHSPHGRYAVLVFRVCL